MPFVSRRDDRARSQDLNFQEEYVPRADFGDVFAASVGQTIDEELSISSALNREGWSDRRSKIEAMIDSGAIDRRDYTKRIGRGKRFDYDKAASDFEEIKSDEELTEERNALLKSRREYAQDVFDRGSGVARFLGAGNAFMLDPLSIATMPLSYSVGAARGLAAVGRSAVKAGAIESVVEAGIQGFVSQHKDEIDSPYAWQDAIANIATAATGAALLTGTGAGIKEYISSVRKGSNKLPGDDSLEFADETLARFEQTLESNPLRKEGMTSEEKIKADADFLRELEVRRSKQDRTTIDRQQLKKIDDSPELSARELSVMDKVGQTEEYAQDIAAYKRRFPIAEPEAPALKGIEIDEDVKIKETGEVVKLKADAEKLYRQAGKRMEVIKALRGCLNA
jgi:hypothetical protein